MAVETEGVQPGLPESEVKENIVKEGTKQDLESIKDPNQSELPVENGLPTINEELAKIFPENAHKFLKEKASGKRGRPRKYPEKSEQKTTNRGRGRPRKEVDITQPLSQPEESKKVGKVGRPRKRPKMSADYQRKEISMKDIHIENQHKEQTFENNDTYIDDDVDEESGDNDEDESHLKHKVHNNEKIGVVEPKEKKEAKREYMKPKKRIEKQGDTKREENNDKRVYKEPKECDEEKREDIKPKESNEEKRDNIDHVTDYNEQEEDEDESNDDVSEESLECDSYDESESGFESDNPAYTQGTKDKRRKRMDYLDEDLPEYRIMKETDENQAGLSRYQILKVRLLKFQATKGRGRPRNKLKIAGAKRGRGRPRKNEMKTRTLKVNLDPLPDLNIYSTPRSVKGHLSEGQGQSHLLSEGNTVKRKPGRPPKKRLLTEDNVTNGQSTMTNGQGSSGQTSGLECSYQIIGQGSSGQVIGQESSGQATGQGSSGQATGQESSGQATGQGSSGQATGQESSGQVIGQESSGQATGQGSSGQATGQGSSGQVIGQGSSGQVIGQGSNGLIKEEGQSYSSNMSVKYEDQSSSLNDSSCGQTCDENESKRDKKKKKKKKGRPRRDSISKMTSVSVSIQRLETVFNMKLLEDAQKIWLKQEETALCEANVTEEDNVENIDVKQDRSDTIADKADIEIDCMSDEQDWEGGSLGTRSTEERSADMSEVTENRKPDTLQDDEDGLAESEQKAADRLMDTQNYYLNQEVVCPMLSLKKRGRPPKPNHLKITKKIEKPLHRHPLKKGRGRPKKCLKDELTSYTEISTLNTYPSGKVRGRPKGRKNKQLEYERLIEDIENKEELNKNKMEDSRKAELDSHNHAGTSKTYNKLSEFTLSKRCPSAYSRSQLPVKDPVDVIDNVSEHEDKAYTLSPQDIFEMDNAGKLTETNQSVFQFFETGSKNFTSDSLPAIPEIKIKDCEPHLVVTSSQMKDYHPLPAGPGSKRLKIDKSLSRTHLEAKDSQSKSDRMLPQSCSMQDLSPDYSHVQSSPRKKSNNYNLWTQSTYKTKDLSVGDLSKSSAAGSSTILEASTDPDQHQCENRFQFSTSQQTFSGGLLDFHAPADPDYIVEDDYLLAF